MESAKARFFKRFKTGTSSFAAWFAEHFAAAKSSANLEIENEYEIDIKDRGLGGKEKFLKKDLTSS